MTDPISAPEFLAPKLPFPPRVALILGSGLGALAEEIEERVAIPYGEIPGYPVSTVAGHAGRVVAGRLEGVPVVAFQGRFHAYEGHPAERLALPVRTAAALGAETLVVTCAAGGVNPRLGPGDLMIIDDHINLMWRNPLIGPVREGDERFPDMSRPYDPEYMELAEAVARERRIAVVRGVYAAVLGPSYETPAEIRMLGRFGADAVGMSTVPEVVAARAAGMRVLGLALITNQAAGISGGPLHHDEVIAAGAAAAERFRDLVLGFLARLR